MSAGSRREVANAIADALEAHGIALADLALEERLALLAEAWELIEAGREIDAAVAIALETAEILLDAEAAR